MITKDRVTEIFCIIDEFDKNLSAELAKSLRLPSRNSDGKRYRNRKGRLSESEIMTILTYYHFGTYRNIKEVLHLLRWLATKTGVSGCHFLQSIRGTHATCFLQDDAVHEALCLWQRHRHFVCWQRTPVWLDNLVFFPFLCWLWDFICTFVVVNNALFRDKIHL